jgi:hypothetical protein
MKKIILIFVFTSFLSCSNNNKIRMEIKECLESKFKETNPSLSLYKAYLILEKELIENKLLIKNDIVSYTQFIDLIILKEKEIDIDILVEIRKNYTDDEVANLNLPTSLNSMFCFVENKNNILISNNEEYKNYIDNIELLFKTSSDKDYYIGIKKIINSTPEGQFKHIEYRAPVINSIFNYLYLNLDFEKI